MKKVKKNFADSKKSIIFASAFGGIAQLARAPALQAGGRRFDSDYLHNERPDHIDQVFFVVEILMIPQSLCDSPQGHADHSLCSDRAAPLLRLFAKVSLTRMLRRCSALSMID